MFRKMEPLPYVSFLISIITEYYLYTSLLALYLFYFFYFILFYSLVIAYFYTSPLYGLLSLSLANLLELRVYPNEDGTSFIYTHKTGFFDNPTGPNCLERHKSTF